MISSKIKLYKEKLDRLLSEHSHACKLAKEEKQASTKAKEQVTNVSAAQKLVQQIAKEIQATAHHQISSVVSRCLEAVFDEPYTFRIVFEEKRGRTEARLIFVRDGYEIDPTTASGVGVIDVAAFSLRLACLILAQPKRRRLLVMDEPFHFISREHWDRLRSLLQTLTKEMQVQFLIATHNPKLITGTIVELE